MNKKNTTLFLTYTSGNLRHDSLIYNLVAGFKHFLDVSNSRRNNMKIVDAIDWLTIYQVYDKAFNDYWQKLVSAKYREELNDFGDITKSDILSSIKYKLYYEIFIIIQNKDLLKKSSSNKLDKLINNESTKIIKQVFEMLYDQSSLVNLNNEKVEKLAEWAEKMGGRRYEDDKLSKFDEIIRKYDEERKKEYPRKLRSITFEILRKHRILDTKKQENFYKSISKYIKKYRI